MTGDGTFSYDYDDEGNLITKDDGGGGVWQYEYDYRNRLTAARYYSEEVLSIGIHYEYDALNRRVARWIDEMGTEEVNFLEQFVYDGDHVVLDFEDADGEDTGSAMELRNRYLYGPAVDQILAQENVSQGGSAVGVNAAERVYWFFGDNQGTTRDLVDNAAAVAQHFEYNPFGLIEGTPDTELTRYLYTAREFDPLTWLQYNRNRWYDPQLERWMSQDPIGFVGDQSNLYRYVGNSPTNFVDPDGLLKRNLAYKASGNKIAAYSVHWNNFKLDAPAKCDTVLIQHITVQGTSNVDGKLGPIQYFEILGVIKKGQTSLGKNDYWNYVGDVQYPKSKPQITEEEVKQTGQVTAYQYTDDLKKVLDTWKPFQPVPIGNTSWTSGGYPSSQNFNAAGAIVVETEKEPHVLISTWNPTAKNKVKVDGK